MTSGSTWEVGGGEARWDILLIFGYFFPAFTFHAVQTLQNIKCIFTPSFIIISYFFHLNELEMCPSWISWIQMCAFSVKSAQSQHHIWDRYCNGLDCKLWFDDQRFLGGVWQMVDSNWYEHFCVIQFPSIWKCCELPEKAFLVTNRRAVSLLIFMHISHFMQLGFRWTHSESFQRKLCWCSKRRF